MNQEQIKSNVLGGDPLAFQNYVIGFSDGTVKVGTTSRGNKRVSEVVRKKLKNSSCNYVTSLFMSDHRTRFDAYRIERDTCFLIKSKSISGTREWFEEESWFIEQTVIMFSQGIGLKRSKA